MEVTCADRSSPVWRVEWRSRSGGDVLIDREGVDQLIAILDRADASPGCRVLVLASAVPNQYCLGMDLAAVSEMSAGKVSRYVARFADCLTRLRYGGKAVVSLIDGQVVGGGVGLAAIADVAIATRRATFALPELVFGLLPAIVLASLLGRLPPQKARLLSFCDGVDGQRAYELGLVDQLVDDSAGLERAARRQIKTLLRCSPEAIAGLKAFSAEATRVERRKSFVLAAERTAELVNDSRRIALVKRFLAGELPPWFEHLERDEETT
jgi:enoyl-CoA hydratase/carnithine racemase